MKPLLFSVLTLLSLFELFSGRSIDDSTGVDRQQTNCILGPPSNSSSSAGQKIKVSGSEDASETSADENSETENSSSSSAKASTKLPAQSNKSSTVKSSSENVENTEDQSSESRTLINGGVDADKSVASKAAKISSQNSKSSSKNSLSRSESTSDKDQVNMAQLLSEDVDEGSADTPSAGSSSKKAAVVVSKKIVEIPGAIPMSRIGKDNSGVKFEAKWVERTSKNNQGNVWNELDTLRGRDALSAGEIQEILSKSVPDKDYPIYSFVPSTSFRCENVNQPGFYADPEARCQVIRRCDINAIQWNYLCPNATLFNQITLICDWYFNVDCSKAVQYYDYSNSRLYHSDWLLLDTPAEKQ